MAYSEELIQEAIRLYVEEERTLTETASLLGVRSGAATVGRWLREHDIPRRSRAWRRGTTPPKEIPPGPCERCGRPRPPGLLHFCSRNCQLLSYQDGRERWYVSPDSNCVQCGDKIPYEKRFTTKLVDKRRFCSQQCSAQHLHQKALQRSVPVRPCLHCGEPLRPDANRRAKFCSVSCASRHRQAMAGPQSAVTAQNAWYASEKSMCRCGKRIPYEKRRSATNCSPECTAKYGRTPHNNAGTPERIEAAKQMRLQGKTYAEIGAEFGVGTQAIRDWMRKAGMPKMASGHPRSTPIPAPVACEECGRVFARTRRDSGQRFCSVACTNRNTGRATHLRREQEWNARPDTKCPCGEQVPYPGKGYPRKYCSRLCRAVYGDKPGKKPNETQA